jgi:hypothetical protein
MGSVDGALEDLAERLRERLLAEAAEDAGMGPPPALDERIRLLVEREAGLLDARARADLAARIARRSFGLGPLDPLLADPEVDEIMVNGAGAGGSVWVERRGRLEPTAIAFASEDELRHAIERVLAPLGRRVDEAEPLCDARLSDRTRALHRLSARRLEPRKRREPSVRASVSVGQAVRRDVEACNAIRGLAAGSCRGECDGSRLGFGA